MLLIALIAVFLLSSADISKYTVVDISYWGRTDTSVLIQTAYDYNNISDIKKFPAQLGEWSGQDFKYSERVYENLDADILLSRVYWNNGNVIWIDFINSKTSSSFHDPKICYAGWNITNESIEAIRITGNKSYFVQTNIYVNKIEVQNKLEPNKSQVVLFWFMFKPFNKEYGVTMIRLSAPVYSSTAETYMYMKEFIEKELFEAMYENVAGETRTYGEDIIATHGILGMMGIGIMFLLPMAMLFPGKLRGLVKKIREK